MITNAFGSTTSAVVDADGHGAARDHQAAAKSNRGRWRHGDVYGGRQRHARRSTINGSRAARPLSGATNSVLTLANVQAGERGPDTA